MRSFFASIYRQHPRNKSAHTMPSAWQDNPKSGGSPSKCVKARTVSCLKPNRPILKLSARIVNVSFDTLANLPVSSPAPLRMPPGDNPCFCSMRSSSVATRLDKITPTPPTANESLYSPLFEFTVFTMESSGFKKHSTYGAPSMNVNFDHGNTKSSSLFLLLLAASKSSSLANASKVTFGFFLDPGTRFGTFKRIMVSRIASKPNDPAGGDINVPGNLAAASKLCSQNATFFCVLPNASKSPILMFPRIGAPPTPKEEVYPQIFKSSFALKAAAVLSIPDTCDEKSTKKYPRLVSARKWPPSHLMTSIEVVFEVVV
mmetsp:Transcript_7908/g.24872  ORF Transcript_7908/g.24872 Transcript_7908/m.24872 type:complete len:316 (-) Transcript_7908:465-1412(-)